MTTKCTVKAFSKIMEKFLPVPKKSHYIFNLRDLSKVFQGFCLATPKTFPNEELSFIKLWIHEMQRVFRDRLIEDSEGIEFDNLMSSFITDGLERDLKNKINTADKLIFGDFMDNEAESKV